MKSYGLDCRVVIRIAKKCLHAGSSHERVVVDSIRRRDQAVVGIGVEIFLDRRYQYLRRECATA